MVELKTQFDNDYKKYDFQYFQNILIDNTFLLIFNPI